MLFIGSVAILTDFHLLYIRSALEHLKSVEGLWHSVSLKVLELTQNLLVTDSLLLLLKPGCTGG